MQFCLNSILTGPCGLFKSVTWDINDTWWLISFIFITKVSHCSLEQGKVNVIWDTRFLSVVLGCTLLLLFLFSGTETLLEKYSEWYKIGKWFKLWSLLNSCYHLYAVKSLAPGPNGYHLFGLLAAYLVPQLPMMCYLKDQEGSWGHPAFEV